MPRLTNKQKAVRCITDLKDLKIAEQVRREYGQRMLTCHNEELAPLRMKAQMLDDLLDELERKANKGELNYG